MSDDSLLAAAEALAAQLRVADRRIVLAESCTGGLAASTLARIPGISEFLCGSAVVYRDATKIAWLGVSDELLDDPSIGPVSSQTAGDMARGVLSRTWEAHLAGSITGHLGPDARDGLDGVIFVGTAQRDDSDSIKVVVRQHILDRVGETTEQVRHHRQQAAASHLLRDLTDDLSADSV